MKEGRIVQTTNQLPHYDVAVVGAGPAGLALSNELLKAGIDFAVIGKPRRRWGRKRPDYGGALATYDIPANSKGNELLLAIESGDLLARAQTSRPARRLEQMTDVAPNLKRQVGPYLLRVGKELQRIKPNEVYAQEVGYSVWDGEKYTVFDIKGKALLTADFISANVGAGEIRLADVDERFDQYRDKIRGSLSVIRGSERRKIKKQLKRRAPEDRWIVVVGASHTAFTDAAIFSERRRHRFFPKKIGDLLPDKHLVIAHRGEIKVYAESADQAMAEGLVGAALKESDPRICPRTKRWRRFGGFREWAKQTYMEWRAGERPQIDVMKLDDVFVVHGHDVLKKAEIVEAVGLIGNELPIFDRTGNPYLFQRSPDGDIQGDANGWLGIPNGYGGGIGVDVLRPDEELGGEPEFSNNPNGFLHFVAGYNEVALRQAKEIKGQLARRKLGT